MKFIDVDISSRCRLACPKCARTILKKVKIIDIDLSLIEKICSISNPKILNMGGTMGDPIYHPKFHKILEICNKSNSTYYIHTNGSGKTLDWWKKTFDLMKDDSHIYFSIDGLEDTCGGYRVNFSSKDFYEVLEVLKLANNYKFKTYWVYTPFNFNEHQIVKAAKLAIENNIKFIVRKSSRWNSKDDKLRPMNSKLSVYVEQ